MQRRVIALPLCAGDEQPADGRAREDGHQDGLQSTNAFSRGDDACNDGEKRATHLCKHKYKREGRRVQLWGEQLRSDVDTRRKERAGEETDKGDGDGRSDYVGHPGSR